MRPIYTTLHDRYAHSARRDLPTTAAVSIQVRRDGVHKLRVCVWGGGDPGGSDLGGGGGFRVDEIERGREMEGREVLRENGVRICMCVRERVRESDRERETERESFLPLEREKQRKKYPSMWQYVHLQSYVTHHQ